MIDLTSEAGTPSERTPSEPIWTKRTAITAGALAVLIAIADLLFWPYDLGINTALYCLALIVAVLALNPEALKQRRTIVLTVAAVLAVLPLAESSNILWWPMALGLVSLLAVDASGLLPKFEDWFGTAVRFGVLSPVRLIADGFRLLGEAGEQKLGGYLVRLILVWIVPIAFALVFAFLFLVANPVLELGFHTIHLERLFELLDPARIFIWGFFAAISWPILSPKLLAWTALPEVQGPVRPKPESVVFGSTAIGNSLIVFNALFAVQTVMDLMYLWGGVRLPDGVTYADYAHHAAYPLIITAVLAGAFVLAAMRKDGPGRNDPLIRNLVYLWIGQNVWLVISSILRLKLYVEVYLLTELRIVAGIWMLLVAVGLILILAKIVLDKSNRWLVVSNCVLLVLALYAIAWIDFPAVISRYNVEHSREMTGQGVGLDLDYFHRLGPGTIPAIDELLRSGVLPPMEQQRFADARDSIKMPEVFFDEFQTTRFTPREWQAWTWREDRLRRYLDDHPFAPAPEARHN